MPSRAARKIAMVRGHSAPARRRDDGLRQSGWDQRHLAWDGGYGFDPAHIRLTGRIVIVVAVLATAAFAYAAIF